MTAETLGVVAVVALAFFVLRRLQAPKHRTRRLAITVWAAFGPHDTAERAANGLRRASRAVFGREGITEHEEWIQGHVKNFLDWEAKGSFQRAQKIMRTGLLLTAYGRAFEDACKEVKAEALTQVQETTEWLNKDYLEKTGHRLEAVKQPDGALELVYKQIWPDEEVKRKEHEDWEAVLSAIGSNLLEDRSNEAQQLLAFLSVVYQTNMGKDLESPNNVGVIWAACLEVLDKDPNSEVAQTFKVLNGAWTATRADKKA